MTLNTPGARAAIQATNEIPIVMTAIGDPVGSGFVSNLARPGGNVTGISNLAAELASKRLALLKEVVPGARRIAAMFNPDDPVTVPQLRDAERAAPVLKIEIRFFPVRAVGSLPETFKQMLAWRADAALWILGQHQAFQTGSIELAASHRLPLLVGAGQNVEAGGLIGVERLADVAKAGLLDAAVEEPILASEQFVADERGEEVDRGELLGLGLEQPHLQAGGQAGEPELVEGALQFDEVHVGISSWVLCAMTSR